MIKRLFFQSLIKSAADDFTYSAVMRQLRKEYPEQVMPFLKRFKEAFDQACKENVKDKEKPALMQALQSLGLHEKLSSSK